MNSSDKRWHKSFTYLEHRTRCTEEFQSWILNIYLRFRGFQSSLQLIRLILQQNGNVSWRWRAQIKQLAWPMAERQIEHRKSCLVLSARFPVVNWRSRPVAKSACLLPRRALWHGTKVWHRINPIWNASLSRSTRRSFAPSPKSRRYNHSNVCE